MNCAEVKERLVDFLYDELAPAARAAFAEHLRGCPRCGAEVAEHRKTLGQARTALAGPLLEEPPVRVRAAAVAAARQAAAAKAPARHEETRPRRESRAREHEPGLLARFWRAPWLLPAFGAVSVATAVFLVKVLKNPDGLPGQRPRLADEVATGTPAAPDPALGAPAEAVAPPAEPTGTRTDEAEGQPPATRKGAASKARARATSAARARASTPAGAAPSRWATPPPGAAPKSHVSLDPLSELPRRQAAPLAADREALAPVAEKKAAGGARREGAPAPGNTVAVPSPSAAPPLPAPPSPSRALKAKAERAAPDEAERPDYASEPADDGRARAQRDKEQGSPALDEARRRADRLFAAGDWPAASKAYRELLRRFPSDPDVPVWRERMNRSLVAAEAARQGENAKTGQKATKATSNEALSK